MKDPLKTYRVVGLVTISMSTLVKARSKKEALVEAGERGLLGLCHQCASGEQDVEWVTSGELDGEPKDMVAEEE